MSRPIDEEKLKKLKSGVIRLIVEDGYKGVGISKLSKITGISAGYLYRYYANKDELINSAMDDIIEESASVLAELMKKSDTIEEFITVVYNSVMNFTRFNINDFNFFVKTMIDPSLEKFYIKLVFGLRKGILEKLGIDDPKMLEEHFKESQEQMILLALTNIAMSIKLKYDYKEVYDIEYPISDEKILRGILALCKVIQE